MADPFRVLRAPVTPADPDPAFAARLRARLERALDLPEGVAVSDTGAITQPHPAPVAATRRRGARDETPGGSRAPRQGDIGYASLWVPDIGRAAAFYAAVFGWAYGPSHNPHARQVPGVAPPQGLWGGQPRSTLFCSYVVDNAVAAAARVRAAGGQAGDPIRRPYGLVAECTDNQGTRFAVHQYPAAGQPGAGAAGTETAGAGTETAGAGAGPVAAAHDGDLAYITFEVVDSRRARDFYGAVLGWRFAPGRVADGWQVEGTTPMAGLSGGHVEATTVPMWRVANLREAVSRVRAAGGTATEPRQEPYGLTADCADDQGSRFYLGQFPAG
jgi:predicted enzyme related to lactoylglutathione lyase